MKTGNGSYPSYPEKVLLGPYRGPQCSTVQTERDPTTVRSKNNRDGGPIRRVVGSKLRLKSEIHEGYSLRRFSVRIRVPFFTIPDSTGDVVPIRHPLLVFFVDSVRRSMVPFCLYRPEGPGPISDPPVNDGTVPDTAVVHSCPKRKEGRPQKCRGILPAMD